MRIILTDTYVLPLSSSLTLEASSCFSPHNNNSDKQLLTHTRRLVESCTQKCVAPNYNDGELAKGESVCLDRCFAKYVETQEQIGKKMNELQSQAMGDQPAQ